jgi:hypothetical protein
VNFESQISNLKFRMPGLRFLWWWIRQVTGDSAYENYLRFAARTAVAATDVGAGHRACPDGAATGGRPYEDIMSREEFFLDSLRRRYSSVSRCC